MSALAQFWWNWGVQLAVAVGTLAAATVALRLHVKFFPPVLRLIFAKPEGRPTPVALRTMQDGAVVSTRGERGRYYHVELKNERPLIPATNPIVYLLAVEVPDAAGSSFSEVWAGALPIVATYYEVHPGKILGADPQLYDLCSVVRGKWVELHPQIQTMDFPKLWSYEGETIRFRVTLQARSLEVLSPRYVFEIAWDGEWAEDTTAMRRHMVVRQIS